MTKIIVVRHAQSLANEKGIFIGHMDMDLSELGKKQAELLGKYLLDKAFPIDVIYSSDLSRAMKTAEPTAITHGLEIIPDARLREICGGDW